MLDAWAQKWFYEWKYEKSGMVSVRVSRKLNVELWNPTSVSNSAFRTNSEPMGSWETSENLKKLIAWKIWMDLLEYRREEEKEIFLSWRNEDDEHLTKRVTEIRNLSRIETTKSWQLKGFNYWRLKIAGRRKTAWRIAEELEGNSECWIGSRLLRVNQEFSEEAF